VAQQQGPSAALTSAVNMARSAVFVAESAVSATLFLLLLSSLLDRSDATPVVVKTTNDPRKATG